MKPDERWSGLIWRLEHENDGLEDIRKELDLLRDPNDRIYVCTELLVNLFRSGKPYDDETIPFLQNIINSSNEEARDLSMRDSLTGLFNRRCLESRLKMEFALGFRNPDVPFSIMMFDIDYFGDFNNTYGHNAGDSVLSSLGNVISTGIRGSNAAFRYGGEEFVLLFPGISEDIAMNIAYRVGEDISNTKMRFVGKDGAEHEKQITVSAGILGVTGSDPVWLLYGDRGRKLIVDYVKGVSDFGKELDFYYDKRTSWHKPSDGVLPSRDCIKGRAESIGNFIKSYAVENSLDIDNLPVDKCAMGWIIGRADSLMYYVKEQGRNDIAYLDSDCSIEKNETTGLLSKVCRVK